MRLQIIFLLCVYVCQMLAIKYPIKPDDGGLTTPEMIRNHGYPCEIHHITTEDGFILEYHRVPRGFKDKVLNKKRPPLILMHGLSFTSVQDFAQGPKKGLGYLLADNGFDVWAANHRGNHFSRNHTQLDWIKNQTKYFDFSFHEIGYYDVPAAMDYITNVTGFEKMFYFGNSLGGSVFLTFGPTRPDYVKRIKLAVLVSPAGYMKNQHMVQKFISYYKDALAYFLEQQNLVYSFFNIRKAWYEITTIKRYTDIGMAIFTELLKSEEDAEALKPYLGAYLTNFPSEYPTKHITHYMQLISSGTFRQFDYGVKKNFKKYGSKYPPSYNISAIDCPVALYYAKADFIIHYQQQLRLQRELPNVVHHYLESTGRYNHLSFGGAKDVERRVWPDVIAVLKKYV